MPDETAVASAPAGPSARLHGRALRVAFAGTPAFARTSLAALIAGPHELVGVLTQPDRPAGRGRKSRPSEVKALALEHGLSVLQPPTLRDADAQAALAALAADVLVVVAYGLILPAEVLASPPLGCLNVHGSLLPRWRGAAPVQRAILAGDAETGVCIMHMDVGLDTGDVLARAATPIGPDENASELTERLADLGARTLGPALEKWRDGALVPEPQPDDGITYAAKLGKAEARLDFAAPALALHRAVRAFHGWPVAEGVLEGERVRIWESRLPAPGTARDTAPDTAPDTASNALSNAAPAPDAPPGTVLAAGAESLLVMAGDGPIEFTTLQRPGGRAVGAGAFAQGRELAGRRFEPVADVLAGPDAPSSVAAAVERSR